MLRVLRQPATPDAAEPREAIDPGNPFGSSEAFEHVDQTEAERSPGPPRGRADATPDGEQARPGRPPLA